MLYKYLLLALIVLSSSAMAQNTETRPSFSPVNSEQHLRTNSVEQRIDAPERLNTPSQMSFKTYGPVANNEALWDIANQIRSAPSESNGNITTAQMAVALFRNNPDAFIDKNINGLLTGAVLKIPEKKGIIQLSQQQAELVFQQHWQKWQDLHALETVARQVTEEIDAVATDTGDIVAVIENPPENPLKDTPIDTQVTTMTRGLQEPEHTIQNASDPEAVITSISKESESKIQDSELNISNKPRLLESLSQIKLQNSFSDIVQYISVTILPLWQDFKLNVWNKFAQHDSFSLAVLVMLFVLVAFLALVYFFRSQEVDYTEDSTIPPESSLSAKDYPLTEGSKRAKGSTLAKGSKATKNDHDERHVVLEDLLYEMDDHNRVQQVEEAFSVSTQEMPSQVNINKFLKPKQKRQAKERIGLLEKAFDCNGFLPGTGVIPEKSVVEEQESKSTETIETTDPNNLLDSIEEIKYVQKTAHDTRISAFLKATQSENETLAMDEILASEFARIKDNEKIELFIEEFEQLISSLNKQTPVIKKAPYELENLIQFKLSIHFIKVLSEMMQATQLNQFSQTVIEFLEDIVDGKTRMTGDVIHRLSIVVNFYGNYINMVKNNHSCKV